MLSFAVVMLLTTAQPSPDKVLAGVRATYLAGGNIEADFEQVYVEKLRQRTHVLTEKGCLKGPYLAF